MILINSEIADATELEKKVIRSLEEMKILHSKEEFDRNLKIINERLSVIHKTFDECVKRYRVTEKPIHSHRRITGKIKVFIKKIIRKSTRWLFLSYIEQQTAYNSSVNDCLEEMIKIQDKLAQSLRYLEKKDED